MGADVSGLASSMHGGLQEMPFDTFIVFAREPVLGQVKQRLAAETSPVFALRVYVRMLERSLRLAHSWRRSGPADPGRQVIVAASNAQTGGRLARWCERTDTLMQHQADGDLGVRMHAAMLAAFHGGARSVVLAGCDCPGLGLADRQAAFDALRAADVVLSPTLDGGYCLIGLNRPHPELFERVDWGSDKVAEQTRQRAAGLKRIELLPRRDVDHYADWQAWCQQRQAVGLPEATGNATFSDTRT